MEFQQSYLKSQSLMLSKCWIQYFSKFRKPSSGHRTGKCHSSSQFPRRVALKNVQITRQLHSYPMLVRLCSKFFKPGFLNQELPDVQGGFRKGRGTRDWIANICWIIDKAREFHKNIYFYLIDNCKPFDCMENSQRDGNIRPSYLSSEVCRRHNCMQVKNLIWKS